MSEEKEAIPIELLYNERSGESGHPVFDVARVAVDHLEDRLVIQVPQPGRLILSHKGWATLVQKVNEQFEEVHQ